MEQEDQKILSLCYAGGNFGAALFNSVKLELLRDIPDLSPGYEMLTSLVYHLGERQAAPDIAGELEMFVWKPCQGDVCSNIRWDW